MENSNQNDSARDSVIAALAKDNQILIITDLHHYDDNVHTFLANQIEAVSHAGVKHLYIEDDPEDFKKDYAPLINLTRNIDPSELLAFESSINNPYINSPDAKLYIEAKRLGVEIHPFDDRSQIREINLTYENESKLMYEDPSRSDSELIKLSPNPVKMADYLTKFNAAALESTFRDRRMLENITADMAKHPDDKAMIIVGADHTASKQDLDEGLRLAGYQTTSVAVTGVMSKVDMKDSDLPDMVVSSDTVKFSAQKNGKLLEPLNADDVPRLHNYEAALPPTIDSVLNGLYPQKPLTIKEATDEVIGTLHKSQLQSQQDANTFKIASENKDTNWSKFTQDNPNLVTQVAIHLAAVEAGHPKVFVQKIDENIIKNTEMGIPMRAMLLQNNVQENIDNSINTQLR